MRTWIITSGMLIGEAIRPNYEYQPLITFWVVFIAVIGVLADVFEYNEKYLKCKFIKEYVEFWTKLFESKKGVE